MEIECPNCFYEQCYWENRHYVCPDCGYEWPDDMITMMTKKKMMMTICQILKTLEL